MKCNWTNDAPIPSGELTFCYGKSPFLMGKSTISMAIFNCYVSSPEGNCSTYFSSNSSHQRPQLQQVASYTQRCLRCRNLPLGSQCSQLAASGDQKISGRPKVEQSPDGNLRKKNINISSNQSLITCGFFSIILMIPYQSLSTNDYTYYIKSIYYQWLPLAGACSSAAMITTTPGLSKHVFRQAADLQKR